MSQTTEQIWFSGHVQGVGFRWSTHRIASRLPVSGFVRNLPDGRVEVVISGTPDSIQSLIDGLHERFGNGIANVERLKVEVSDAFSSFEIRR